MLYGILTPPWLKKTSEYAWRYARHVSGEKQAGMLANTWEAVKYSTLKILLVLSLRVKCENPSHVIQTCQPNNSLVLEINSSG